MSHHVTESYNTLTCSKTGISIRAQRLFGKAPKNATYLCSWEFYVAQIGGHVDLDLLDTLQTGMNTFAYNYVDRDNAPLPVYMPAVDPDSESAAANPHTDRPY